MDEYRVIRATGVPMSSPEGSSMLAGLFGDAVGPDDVEVFPVRARCRERPRPARPHLRSCGVGDRGKDGVRVLQARQAHSEEVVGGQRATMV